MNGELDGTYKIWYIKTDISVLWDKNNSLSIKRFFVNGSSEGLYQSWYEDGQLYSEVNYISGEEVSANYWDETGVLMETVVCPFNACFKWDENVCQECHPSKETRPAINGCAGVYSDC